MAEPRKVQFVTLSAFAAGAAAESRKRRLEDESEFSLGRAGEVETAAGAGGSAGGDRSRAKAEKRATVRLNLTLSEPSDVSSAEFNYGELIHNLQVEPPDLLWAFGWICSCSWCLRGLVVAGRRGGRTCPRWPAQRLGGLLLQTSGAAMEPASSPLPGHHSAEGGPPAAGGSPEPRR
ncbi:unnamed protein product [Tetraodon nigroviridis]|uniref:(spotted green pufferfish) hypothetical protein n=1 Tax=Tetraodon nigroviridis TaxID=99883 RepID=Q4RLE7_TETNG|nr:unnamed protein product [Tetraodon nigroviridis]